MNSNKTLGKIFNIQRYSLHDGAGLRTVVFFKGCTLHCKWCSNPESQSPEKEYYISQLSCIGCGTCVKNCPSGAVAFGVDGSLSFDRNSCTGCGECVALCPSGAFQVYGECASVAEIAERITHDTPFYTSSGGGVTLSGGEPTLQPEFARALLEFCKSYSLNSAIETCGFAKWENLALLLPLLDNIFFDVKHVLPEKHIESTGVDCRPILSNLKRLLRSRGGVTIRIPLIPTFNDDEESLLAISSWIAENVPDTPVELMPYHRYGEKKYKMLGREYLMKGIQEPDKGKMSGVLERFTSAGVSCKVIN